MSLLQDYKKFFISFSEKLENFTISFQERLSIYFHFLNEHKHAKKYFWISLFIPAVLIFVLVVVLPLKIDFPIEDGQISNHKEFISMDADIDNFEEIKKYSKKMFDLKNEEMFLQSRLLLAKSDSIGLVLNLADSTLSLNIRGVNVRECQIYGFKLSHSFKHLKGDHNLFNWLSRPFILQQDWATLPKVPIKIRKAPKDTIEAKKYKREPVTLDKPDVHYTMQFDRHLVIRIHQIESNSVWGSIRKCYYNLILYFSRIMNTFLAFFHFNVPKNPLWIELKISKNDALAVYRALPNHAALALRLHFQIN